MKISDSDKQYLFSLTPDDLTFTTLVSLFGNTTKKGDSISKTKKSRFETTDEMDLNPGEYFNKEKVHTTVGRFIYNKYIVERCGLQDVLGYVNVPLTSGKNKGNESILSKALIDEKITIDQFYDYIDYRDNLGMQLHSVIATSFTPKTIEAPPDVRKKRDELFKKNNDALNKGDLVVADNIKKELMQMVHKDLEGDPGKDLYDSEARGNYGNYENMFLFKGATLNTGTGEYEIVRTAFMDGIQKQDIASFGSSVIAGDYPKAVKS